jgi:hypothetical protein
MDSSSSNNTDGFNSIFYKFEKQYLLEYQNNSTTNIIINGKIEENGKIGRLAHTYMTAHYPGLVQTL